MNDVFELVTSVKIINCTNKTYIVHFGEYMDTRKY